MQEMMQQMFQMHLHFVINRVVALKVRISFVLASQSVLISQSAVISFVFVSSFAVIIFVFAAENR
jgi:hypothetical protein